MPSIADPIYTLCKSRYLKSELTYLKPVIGMSGLASFLPIVISPEIRNENEKGITL